MPGEPDRPGWAVASADGWPGRLALRLTLGLTLSLKLSLKLGLKLSLKLGLTLSLKLGLTLSLKLGRCQLGLRTNKWDSSGQLFG